MFVAITGTIGAGKDTVADYLVTEHGFNFSNGSQLIAEETGHRGLEPTRDNLRKVANDLRASSDTKLIKQVVEKVEDADRALVGFLYSQESVLYIREHIPEAIIIAIDAPIKLRYQRTQERRERKDSLTFTEFKTINDKEMTSESSTEPNISFCLEQADHVIVNDGGYEDLCQQVDRSLDLSSP